ncbi:MAG: DUF815 domain-containing protein [Pseudomonadota bacterium]|nr:ATP-binding protein [Gammaproteobacteria bacterium]MEC8011251.1 DUF815 domain-containing protein [Pseudomonadota bacterium]|tara:strand:- start:64741 stop:65514 length:774 start_codon:yes stop_codon:yes gene_type:complete
MSEHFIFGQWNDHQKQIIALNHIPHKKPEDFHKLEKQTEALEKNIASFVKGGPFLHTLLWGEMGCGKSSLVKSLLFKHKENLSALQIRIDQLKDLQHIIDTHFSNDRQYIIYIDDISLSRSDEDFYFLKTFLDGSFFQVADNIMMIATSNRRHLTPEFMSDNQNVTVMEDALHYGDEKNDALALSDRFGLSVSFYTLGKNDYLELVFQELQKRTSKPLNKDEIKLHATRYAMQKGGHNGRTAMQCIKYIQIMQPALF